MKAIFYGKVKYFIVDNVAYEIINDGLNGQIQINFDTKHFEVIDLLSSVKDNPVRITIEPVHENEVIGGMRASDIFRFRKRKSKIITNLPEPDL